MSTIYIVNVGANTSHGNIARSPIWGDGSFEYVSFPTKCVDRTQCYTGKARSFVQNVDAWRTHADPDWVHLTYGDYCANPRAGALRRVGGGDILLFWGLLWSCRGADWAGFTGERDWYLLGALRVSDVLDGGKFVSGLSRNVRARAALNAHLDGDEQLRENHRVFIGDPMHSTLFDRAIELGVSIPDGLIYRTFMASSRQLLSHKGMPAWQSSLRSCRPMWNLNHAEDKTRAALVGRAISSRNDFDLLKGL